MNTYNNTRYLQEAEEIKAWRKQFRPAASLVSWLIWIAFVSCTAAVLLGAMYLLYSL